MGIVPFDEALAKAEEATLDLVEITKFVVLRKSV
nr:hypothetical protein [Salinivibrio kushneri]